MQFFQKHSFRAGAVCTLIQIAGLAFHEEQPQQVALLLGAAQTFGPEVDAPPYWMNCVSSLWYHYAQGAIVKPLTAAVRTQLGDTEFEAAFASGQCMTLDEAITLALEKSKSELL